VGYDFKLPRKNMDIISINLKNKISGPTERAYSTLSNELQNNLTMKQQLEGWLQSPIEEWWARIG